MAHDPSRRDLIVAVGAIALAARMPSGLAQVSGNSSPSRNSGPLGARLQGVQHFGLTVQNMNRAFEFYTEVLGGTEVMRDGDFQGERIHNTLLADQEILATEKGVNPRTIGVPDLKGGEQRLDVRFVQFDNVVIELLQYRDADQPMGGGESWAEPRDHMSPAYPRSMHICFYIRDDVDFNQFIRDLEAESARRGMNQVRANRVISVRTEKDRLAAPSSANTNKITEGKSNGWSLIYCKGPEGEQLEFVQALGPVKQTFSSAFESRRRKIGIFGCSAMLGPPDTGIGSGLPSRWTSTVRSSVCRSSMSSSMRRAAADGFAACLEQGQASTSGNRSPSTRTGCSRMTMAGGLRPYCW